MNQVAEDLATLPPLRPWYQEMYLQGGWNKFGKKPPKQEWRIQFEADAFGFRKRRARLMDLEKASGRDWEGIPRRVSVEQASRESTMCLIREMHRAGWSYDEAYAMMTRFDAPGTRWLIFQSDCDLEFSRCWEKAQVPTADLPKPKRKKSSEPFVSRVEDRYTIYGYVMNHPGKNLRALRASKCGLTGRNVNGRLDAGMKILVEEGFILRELGARRAQHHFVNPEQPLFPKSMPVPPAPRRALSETARKILGPLTGWLRTLSMDVYTDGACSTNNRSGKGGWSWVVGEEMCGFGSASGTTSNRMEVTAALRAIDVLPQDGPLRVVSDSQYLIRPFKNRWRKGWRQRNWRTADGRPIANRDLWEPLVDLVLDRGNVEFKWVKSHSGVHLNEVADHLAYAGMLHKHPGEVKPRLRYWDLNFQFSDLKPVTHNVWAVRSP